MKVLFIHRQRDPLKPSIFRSFEPFEDYLRKENEVLDIFLPYGVGSLTNIFRNIKYVRKHRIKDGINHVSGETHYAILGLLGCPSVLTIHDDYAISASPRKGIVQWIKKLLFLTLPIKFADQVVCISPATKAQIDSYVKNSKTKVITHHDITADFPYTPKTFNADCPTIFHMGTAPNKNLETTLKALKGLKCKLRVLKKMTSEQTQLANELGINYVNRYDLTNQEVFEEYNKADIILFPSLYEGLGMPILEGQSIGRPVITTDREPMNWVAGRDGAILLKDPLDADEIRNKIILLCEDVGLRDILVSNGRNNIERFKLPAIYIAYMDVYKKALARHKKQI